MKSLTREQFLGILGLSAGNFDVLQSQSRVALAFGSPLPATPGRYLDLDLVAMALVLAMTGSIRREDACTIVLAFFDTWVRAVGRADADPAQDQFFAVGQVRDKSGRHVVEMLIAAGTHSEIVDKLRGHGVSAVMSLNVSDNMRRIRAKAQAIGVDLSGAFYFPPDDPRHEAIANLVADERDQRLARLRADRKKFAKHKARLRRQDLRSVERTGGEA
jgi:hypothetical protein